MPTWGEILDRINQGRDDLGSESFDVVRRHYLEKLAEYTDNDVILYSTSWTTPGNSGASQSISDVDVQAFMEALSGLDGDTLDLIVHSPGGKPEVVEQIVTYLRSKYSTIRFFVPQSARSAATLIACAADVIYMGDHSSLGPIDPQMNLKTDLGFRMVPAYSILSQFDKARREFEETGNVGHWGPILRQYGPSLISECEDAIAYSAELAEDWSSEYMFDGEDADEKGRKLAQVLNERTTHKSHSRPIMKEEAKDIGLNIADLEEDQKLQDLVLSVFHAAGHTHNGTSAVKIIENNTGNSFVYMSGQSQQQEEEE